MANKDTTSNGPRQSKPKPHDSLEMQKYIEWQMRYGTENLRRVYTEARNPKSGEMIWMGTIKKDSFLGAIKVLQEAGLLDKALNPTAPFNQMITERQRQTREQTQWRRM